MQKYEVLTRLIVPMQKRLTGPVEHLFEEAMIAYLETADPAQREYGDILRRSGITWDPKRMREIDVTTLNATTTLALMIWVLRADHFASGALHQFCADGTILRWLVHLENLGRGQG